MADHEANFLSALVATGQPGQLRGVQADHISARFRPVFDWIIGFVRDHGQMPQKATVEGAFPGLRLPDIQGGAKDVEYYASQVRENAMRAALEAGLTEHVVGPLEATRGGEALSGAKRVVADVSRQFREDDKGLILDLHSNTAQRDADYDIRAKAQGAQGLPLPWATLTRATGGIQPGELWTVLARPNVGKTWALVVMATVLWQAGYRVLFASMETPPQSRLPRSKTHRVVQGRCARCNGAGVAPTAECPAAMTPRQRLSIRFDAIGARLSAFRLLNGCLTPYERATLAAYYEASRDPERGMKYGWGDIRVVSAPLISTLADLETEVAEYSPDVVLWDSAFLATETGRPSEAASKLVRDTKMMCERTTVPCVMSWHFNREVTEEALDASMNDAALTDDIGRICDVLVGLFRPKNVEDAGEAVWRALKVRDGLRMRELKTYFKIKDTIDFGEIGSSESRV